MTSKYTKKALTQGRKRRSGMSSRWLDNLPLCSCRTGLWPEMVARPQIEAQWPGQQRKHTWGHLWCYIVFIEQLGLMGKCVITYCAATSCLRRGGGRRDNEENGVDSNNCSGGLVRSGSRRGFMASKDSGGLGCKVDAQDL